MPNKVAITADSPIDLNSELAKRYNISVIPLYISFENKSYRDGIDISPEDIFKEYENENVIPHTSSIPIADYFTFFRGFTDRGVSVVHFSLSSEISSTYQNAVIAAEGLSNVYIVDSLHLSTGIAMLAVMACFMRDDGLKADMIYKEINKQRNNVYSSFVVDKLEYLRKGGRCSALTALSANVLNIHPSIVMRGGQLELAKKRRGKIETVQLQFISEQLEKDKNINLDRVFICHSGIPAEQLQAIRTLVEKTLGFHEIIVTKAGCTISTHCGPNCLGFSYLRN